MTGTFLQRLARHALGLAAALSGIVALCPAQAQQQQQQRHVSIHPYLEVQQVLTADFGGGETLTYTGVGGGIDASIATRRVQVTAHYDYQHQFTWKKGQKNGDVHTGLVAARLEVVPNLLSMDAGAIATRTHGDVLRPVPALRTTNDRNIADVYSVYGGPTLSTHAGPLAIGAGYHAGYVKVNDHSFQGAPAGTPRVDRYDSSTVQQADASIGMDSRNAPIGWTVGGGWVREDMNRLKSKYDGKYVRGDVVVPISSSFAVTGGGGYEKIKSSQQDVLRDTAGLPVVTADGNLVGDPTKPRLLTYDQSGFIWDVGVIWRPGPRTELKVRGGRRYGSTTVTGSVEHKFNQNYAFSIYAYDNVSSFGRLLVADLNGVPRSFRMADVSQALTGIGGPGGGCVFGTEAGKGTCFGDALQSVNNFNFRNRGVGMMLSGGRGVWSFGLGAGYNNRRYLAPPTADFLLHGVTEQSFTVEADIERRFTRTSGINLDAFAGWYDSGLSGKSSSFNSGLTATYYRSFLTDRLQANVSAGLYTTSGQDFSSTSGTLLLGLRYGF
ncbi:MAG: hypothetical protein QOH81_336 [Sphingomonadales bacterium]|jgi:hypothetical protein|nr:hypothetical protein [Sphingomonadales bacterium]